MFYQRFNLLHQAVSVFRGQHLALLFAAVADEVNSGARDDRSKCSSIQSPATMRTQNKQQNPEVKIDISDGLLLYYDQFSFYSQKVVMALHEKNLPFEKKIVNLIKNEQYESWFLNLNPHGEVPVLQDSVKIIPDSARIIDYLEDNFSNGDTPRLLPMDQGPELRQSVTHFRHILQNVPQGLLTTGAMLNPEFIKSPKIPFLAPIRKALASAERNAGKKLREYAENNPGAREVLLKKADVREANYKRMSDPRSFEEVLRTVNGVLQVIEKELASHKDDIEEWWLCSKSFTIADVELTILLVRISQLGLEHHFWTNGQKPHIERYFERVQLRDSYKKTVPGSLVLLKAILTGQTPLIAGILAAVVLVVGGVFFVKKIV